MIVGILVPILQVNGWGKNMAGSIIWAEYEADDGTTYAVKIDKSNANAITDPGAENLMPTRSTAGIKGLPRGLKMRYCLAYQQDKPAIRRRFWVGNKQAVTNILTSGTTILCEAYPGANDIAGVEKTWVVTAFRGEKSPIIPTVGAPDTGLTDS
jgi:hypothetical protein